ncbi:MAG: hypothetical protein WDA71_10065 [Actinomycetota bacterium]
MASENFTPGNDNAPRYDGAPGLAEMWYSTMTDRATKAGYWFRLTVEVPKVGPGTCRIWAASFRPGEPPLVLRRTYPIGDFSGRDDGLCLPDAELSAGKLAGEVSSRGRKIAWDLSFDPAPNTYQHLPARIRQSKRSPAVVCSPNLDVVFTGKVSVDGKEMAVDAPGQQSHRWGKKHPPGWGWAHGCVWEGGAEGIFEGLSTIVPLGPVRGPKATLLYLRTPEGEGGTSSLVEGLRANCRMEYPRWSFVGTSGDTRVSGMFVLDPARSVQVRYEDPEGSEAFCVNSEVADGWVAMERREGRQWKRTARLQADATAHFELGARKPYPGVPVAELD